MSAFAEYQEIGQLDTNSSLIADLATTNDTLAVTLVYFAPVERPAAFDPFYNIPAVEDTTQIYPNFLALIEGGLPQVVPRWSYGYTNLWLDNVTYVDILNICQEQGTKLAGVNGGTLVIIPQPISKTMVDASQNTGGNPLGLRSRAQLWMNLSFGWNLASDDETVFALIVDLIARIEAVTKARNLYDPYIFLNDAWKEQDVMRHYGDDNFAKLKSVSAKYDPQGTFQYQVPGGFKLI
ncbi:hypothetical protein MMC17_000308 [Xylographa soralifera]|nr:hypothetical protein [Xylographa soralifera]